jgi:hypothetical protein
MKAIERLLGAAAAFLFLGAVIGCGGGAAQAGGGNSTQPTTPAKPSINTLSPSSVIAGSAGLTLTVVGANFVPGSEITWNGTARPTLYLSATSLQTPLADADVATARSVQVAVQDPQTDGGASSGNLSFTIAPSPSTAATVISVAANDLVWDPVNQVIYLSLPGAESNGNSIQVLNPSTGALGTSVFAGSEPDLLALSTTSKYLYAGLDGSSSLQRFNLPALTKDINISFGPASFFGPYVAMDLQASPVSDGTVALVLGTPGSSPEEEGGVQIYDDAVQRPGSLCGFVETGCTAGGGGGLYDSIQWAPTADEMYLLNNEDTGFDFYTVPVTVSGFGTVTSPRQTGRMA